MMYKLEKEHLPAIKTFLVYLHYLPETELVDVPLDHAVVEVLRKI